MSPFGINNQIVSSSGQFMGEAPVLLAIFALFRKYGGMINAQMLLVNLFTRHNETRS